MKLSARYNRVNLVTALIVLLFTGIIYYTVIHFILTDQLDKDLAIEEDEIIEYAHSYNKLPLPGNYKDQKVVYDIIKSGTPLKREFINTEYRNAAEKETEPGRSLITTLNFNGQTYQITITKSRVEAEDLIRIIFFITLGVTSLLLISIILINRFFLNRLWKPFHAVLDQMKAFNIADKNEISPEPTTINEFNELNRAAMSMSFRVKQDYKDLKSFTDNASHEMMTPLAVINSKLDTLLQAEPLSNVQGELIEDIYDAVGRLSRLNHSLLLLAKLENNLIKDNEVIDMQDLIEQKLRQFQELIQGSNIIVFYERNEKKITMSKYLADTLLNNMISNAIRHNRAKGEIRISLKEDSLSLMNTGSEQALDTATVFDRFNKSTSSDGMGLGLAICKQICSLNQFKIDYKYVAGMHAFTIAF